MSDVMRLSPSIAKILLRKSPLHAYAFHRLGGDLKDDDTAAKDRGRVLDKMLLGVGPEIVVCRNVKKDGTLEDGWRTDAIKEMRDAAIAAGKLPVLPGKETEYTGVISAWRTQLEAKGIRFGGYIQERLVWGSDGVECSGQPDHFEVKDGAIMIDDLKTCEDASREAATRAIVTYGYDIQHAAYVEALETLYPECAGRVRMRFLFCEVGAPYAVAVRPIGGTMRELGERKWRRAKRRWAAALAAGKWDGYEDELPIEATTFQLAAEMEQQSVAMGSSDNESAPF